MKIALVGNPNSGKTSLFNKLTGSNQSVGNWPGVTVERKSGFMKHHKDVEIIDLPGVYSLSSMSLEEEITRDYLVSNRPDVILNVVDASSLERSLYLTTQLIEMELPVVVALNMVDILERRNDALDIVALQKHFHVPFVPISAAKNTGIENLYQALHTATIAEPLSLFSDDVRAAQALSASYLRSEKEGSVLPLSYVSLKILEKDKWATTLIGTHADIDDARSRVEHTHQDTFDAIVVNQRYAYISKHIQDCYKPNQEYASITKKVDALLTHRWLGLPIFFLIMWLIYYISITTVGDASIGWIESLTALFSEGTTTFLTSLAASPWVISLVVDGLIAGVGAVLGFVPQIMILYFFIAILEDTGYMSRIAFLMDRIFMNLGLSGKSFIPMIIGTGCSVPGIMATRTIENERDRRLTAIMTPFVPCGAKLPVFALFIAAFFPNSSFVAASLYMISIVAIILSALLLKKVVFKGEVSPYILELPNYKMPQAYSVLRSMMNQANAFIVRAGTVIFIGCTLIWFLQSFNFQLQFVEANESILATLGQLLVPFFAPLGIQSWELSVATLTGFVAKEQIVSTLAILLNTGEGVALSQALSSMLTPIAGYAFMVFVLLASPCFAAIGALRSELKSVKWTAFALIYQTTLAYVIAFLIYQVGSRLF